MNRSERVVHLAGYGTIATVLASATWSGPIGAAAGATFGLATLTYLGNVAFDVLASRLRREAEDAVAEKGTTPTPATDGGGEIVPATPVKVLESADRYGGLEHVREDRVREALESAAATGGDRNRCNT
ncbi:hypothetical protein [Halorarum salinum]|uniref:Uncharacterized protein n=1 Tax=Halorarum salinum TaxID=2743089 RepID=A0A7D5QGF9_9EURY|nr:hypothetical protein [Halobaculum salinum]QLG62203.1 hypothetical protein HUG12_10860 [Halobaculum salinum]